MSGNKLEAGIRRIIEADGPISLPDYMAMCLFDPACGYYTTSEPFGIAGDFITAPEVSQMFGEIIGAWLVHAWRLLERPDPFVLAEMGPGRGTLMRDVLRTARLEPAFLAASRVHLVEASPRLRDVQRKTLGDAPVECTWCETVSALPEQPMLLFANELFDAIPVRQVERAETGWCERTISTVDNGGLGFVLGPPLADISFLPDGASMQPIGTVFEYAPARDAIAFEIGSRLSEFGGAGLLIDYGHENPGFGDTLQAMRRHCYVSVFDTPGEADLTSHVDFHALKNAAEQAGAFTLPVMAQGDYLLSLGLAERAGALGAGKDAGTQDSIRAAAERLASISEGQMGALFKVLCLTGKPMALPPFA
jgi:SAM-dependent MidA family methyltransferase